MTKKIDQYELNMLRYFWEEKADLERCTGWQYLKLQLKEQYPEILEAWNQYKKSYELLSALIEAAEVQER